VDQDPAPDKHMEEREVERTYAGLDHLRQAARQIRELGTGPLRVACKPSLAARMVPRAIRRLSSACPGVRVSLHVPSSNMIWSWASTGQCDIGLVRPRSGYAGGARETFLTVDAVCALPRQHGLARKRTIMVSDLVGAPL
jgi:DNA-binding transcriptional LysR family regulator